MSYEAALARELGKMIDPTDKWLLRGWYRIFRHCGFSRWQSLLQAVRRVMV